MSVYRLRCATRGSAAGVASLAAILLLQAAPAWAGEVITRTCLHGGGGTSSYHYGDSYADQSSGGYGDAYGRGYSFTAPEGFGFRRGFDGQHGRLVVGSRDANGGGTAGGSDAGTSSGSRSGSTSGSGGGSNSSYGADTCIEVRHELVNPYVIPVAPPQSEADYRTAAEHDRMWTARCKPVVRQDSRGIDRYVYAAPGCDYGRYE